MDPNLDAYALKKQNTFLGALGQRLTGGLMGGPQVPPIQGAQNALQGRGYQLHVQQAMAEGVQPMTPEQWARQQQTPRIGSLLGR